MNGAIDTRNKVEHYQFRSKSKNANIYVRGYMPDYERAVLSQIEHQKAILEKTYDEGEPNKKYFLRPQLPLKTAQPKLMRFKAQDTTTRVADSIRAQSPINLDNFNLYKCKVRPDFKEVYKQRWRTKFGFSAKQSGCQEAISHRSSVDESKSAEPYIEGFERLGKKALVRTRQKEREVSKVPFDAMIVGDNWKTKYVNVTSIGGGKNLENSVLQMEAHIDGYESEFRSKFSINVEKINKDIEVQCRDGVINELENGEDSTENLFPVKAPETDLTKRSNLAGFTSGRGIPWASNRS